MSDVFDLKDREEMMVIEINFGSRKDNINVCFGDDPVELAEEFVLKHSLKDKFIPSIAGHIDAVIEEFKKNNATSQPQAPVDGRDDGGSQEDINRLRSKANVNSGEKMMPMVESDIGLANSREHEQSHAVDENKPIEREEEEPQEQGAHLFNKLKAKWKLPKGSKTNSIRPSSTNNASGTEQNHGHLTKSRQITVSANGAINKHDFMENKILNNYLGSKSANERLYHSAAWMKEKAKARIRYEENRIDQSLAEGQFKLKGKSEVLARNRTRLASENSSICERLYTEGILDKERKLKLENSSPVIAEEWSCAQCGTYHKISALAIMKTKRVCTECGWDQEGRSPFKPINIARELMPDNAISNVKENADVKVSSIHAVLHADRQSKDLKRIEFMRKRRQNEDEITSDGRVPFKPSLPEVSEEIVRRRKELTSNNLVSETGMDDLGEYLQKPATERLYSRHLLAKNISAIEKEIKGNKATVEEMNHFINRLVYEYKDKQQRNEALATDLHTYDYHADQPYFQPRLNPFARLDLVTGQTQWNRKGNLEGLLERCDQMALRREQITEEYRSREQKELEESKANTNEMSEKILSEATNKSIEEMFKLLFATEQLKNSKNKNAWDNLTPAKLSQMILGMSDIKDKTIDLDDMVVAIMVPEVAKLLEDVAQESVEQSKEVDDNFVNFETFKKLVLKCLRRREGTGKRYIYVRNKSRHDDNGNPSKIDNYPFKPDLSHNKYVRRKDADIPIEDFFIKEAERAAYRLDESKRMVEQERSEVYTFKPEVIKPPKYIKAKYREVGAAIQKPKLTSRVNGKGRRDTTKDKHTTHVGPSSKKKTNSVYTVNANTSPVPKPVQRKVKIVETEQKNDQSIKDDDSVQLTPFTKHIFKSVMDSGATNAASPASTYSTNIFYHTDASPTLDDPTAVLTNIADITGDTSPTRGEAIDFGGEIAEENDSSIDKSEGSMLRSPELKVSDMEKVSPQQQGSTVEVAVEDLLEDSDKPSPWYENGQWHSETSDGLKNLGLNDSDSEEVEA
jgi:hypothetical protein